MATVNQPVTMYATLLLLLTVACSQNADQSDIQYRLQRTSVAEKDCVELTAQQITGNPLLKNGQLVWRCSGPGDTHLYLVDDGTRSWYVLERGGELHSFEQDIVYAEAPGHFPNVAVDDQVEWLVDDSNRAVGLIFDVVYQVESQAEGFQQQRSYVAYNLFAETPRQIKRSQQGDVCRQALLSSLNQRHQAQ